MEKAQTYLYQGSKSMLHLLVKVIIGNF